MEIIWKRFLRILGLLPHKRRFDIDLNTLQSIEELARRKQRSEVDMAADLLTLGMVKQQENDEYLTCWEALTPREQEITALICLGYKNQEIADRLVISIETVKTHVRHIMQKFRLDNRREMQRVLAHWDFSSWEH